MQNILFDGSTSSISFISFPKDFSIKNENQIIYAPNGTGKTTLFKYISKSTKYKCLEYTYENTEIDIKGKNKEITINIFAKQLAEINDKIADLKARLFPNSPLKGKFRNSTQTAIKGNQVLKAIYLPITKTDYTVSTFPSLTASQREILKPFIENGDLYKLLENESEIKEYQSAKTITDEFIKEMDNISLLRNYDLEKHKEEIQKNGCPFCGRLANKGENLYEIIKQRQKKISEINDTIFSSFKSISNQNNDYKKRIIDSAYEVLNSLSSEQKQTLIFTNGDSKKEKEISNELKQLNRMESKKRAILLKQEKLFTNMTSGFDFVQKNFYLYYPESSVSVDLSAKSIRITLPREFEKYSDGEKHRMFEIFKLLSFLGSDNEIMLIDDPLTQLDLANSYQIMYDFIDTIENNINKRIVIFTCNSETINIAEWQKKNAFKYYYLSSKQNSKKLDMHIYSIPKLTYKIDSGAPYLSFDSIQTNNINKSNPYYSYANVINAIVDRNTLSIIDKHQISKKKKNLSLKQKCLYEDYNKIFHYDDYHYSKELKISNDDLCTLIDNFKSFDMNQDFYDLMMDKILLLVSMRVWIEKRFYSYVTSLPNLNLSKLKKETTIFGKIRFVDKSNPAAYFTKWNKKILLSRKGILNDSCHPLSMTAPFLYAMSVSEQIIENEINNIKEILS